VVDMTRSAATRQCSTKATVLAKEVTKLMPSSDTLRNIEIDANKRTHIVALNSLVM
jgi:hypothetical protein